MGIPRKDVYIDCLTLTVSAEQENAAGTLEAIKYVKEELGLKTVLGVSNISLDCQTDQSSITIFSQMALTCGLDLPIMNPGSPEMMQAVAVYKLIMNIDKGSMAYIKNYSGEVVTSTVSGNPTSAEKPQQESEVEYAINNGLGAKCRADRKKSWIAENRLT